MLRSSLPTHANLHKPSMLTKTLQIRHVGRFDFSAAVELAHATIVYAENGRGKTTLAAILRSLQTGEPLHILERKTIGSNSVPIVGFLASVNAKNSQCNFDGQVWNVTLVDCEIFDSAFVAQNVYSGSEIDPDHRRSLHKFVLGASNVALAKKVDDLDDQIRTATQTIAEAELAVQKLCLDGFGLDQFVKLQSCPTIDADIAAQVGVVEAARAADTIAATQPFARTKVPTFQRERWDRVLATSLADIETQAEDRVRLHVETHLREGAEAWLADGLPYATADICPFCGASVSDNELIRAYRSLFSEEYESLKKAVAAAAREARNALDHAVLDPARQSLQKNSALAPSWAAHSAVCPSAIDLVHAEAALVELSESYSAAFATKTGNILETINSADSVNAAWETLAHVQRDIEQYNLAVNDANTRVMEVKATAAGNSLDDAQQRLKELCNQRGRYQAESVAAVDALAAARKHKKSLEVDKKHAKDELDAATDALFQSYQDTINQHLSNCGCGYSITGTKTVYPGGKPRTDYQLVINSQSIELGTPKTGSAPCFKNTLSDGDKSTLAFALFLARLELDPKLCDKIVVLDDPITSLDAHRRNYTYQQILNLVGRCRQLILLTHDALFARQVWDSLPKPRKALQIADQENKSSLMEWDIMRATQSDYFARYERIYEFITTGKGDPMNVAVALRLLLEGNLRMRFPNEFPAGEWLGDFIKRIKDAKSGDPLYLMQSSLAELTAINDYAKQFHHDPNPAAAAVKPADAELKAYGKRTLAFARGVS